MSGSKKILDKELKGKVVVVTGGGSGLGREISLHFAREGALVAMPDINLSAAQETERIIASEGGRSVALQTDVTSTDDVKKMARHVASELGKIDILVNNAGIIVRTSLLETSEEDWDRTIAVDLRGVYLCTKYVVPEIIKNGGGKIVNIASLAGLVGMTAPSYTAAKGGVISLTRILAGELAPHGINVNAICPGFIATAMSENLRKSKLVEDIVKRIPLGRYGKPEDVAAAAIFLSSKQADYITGIILPLDGGLSGFLDLGQEYRNFDEKKNSG